MNKCQDFMDTDDESTVPCIGKVVPMREFLNQCGLRERKLCAWHQAMFEVLFRRLEIEEIEDKIAEREERKRKRELKRKANA